MGKYEGFWIIGFGVFMFFAANFLIVKNEQTEFIEMTGCPVGWYEIAKLNRSEKLRKLHDLIKGGCH